MRKGKKRGEERTRIGRIKAETTAIGKERGEGGKIGPC